MVKTKKRGSTSSYIKKQDNSNRKIAIIIICSIVGLFLMILMFGVFLFMLVGSYEVDSSDQVNVAIIPVEGVISASDSGSSIIGGGFVSSKEIVSFIEKAERSSSVDAIVFEINSPGGSAVASKEIVDAVKRSKKPKYALIREVGASGAYWLASAVDNEIIANEFSIVGSVGVIGSYFEFSGLLNDFNITYQRLTAGKYKDIGDPFKPLSSDERKILEQQLDYMHEYFLNSVIENRGLENKEDIAKIQTGMFFIGAEALKLNLVDELGDKVTLDNIIKEDFGVNYIKYKTYKKKVGFFDVLGEMANEKSYYVGRGIGKEMLSVDSKPNQVHIIT